LIIGFHGKKYSGKDSAASALTGLGWRRIAFADPVKDAVYRLNPLVWHEGTAQELAALVDELGWDEAKRIPDVRSYVQRMGSEVGRDLIGRNTWVNLALYNLAPEGRYVLPDVRYPNESIALRALGGRVIRIIRPGLPDDGDTHSSEAGLSDELVDWTIYNNGTLETLRTAVLEAVIGLTSSLA